MRLKGTRAEQVHDLFAAHYRPLCRLAFVILRDSAQAEEAVMDAFLSTFTGWRRIGSMDRPDLYVRRAVVNGCASRLRRRAVEARFRSVDHDRPPWEDDERETNRLVRDAIDALPKRQRLCVVLRYFEDLSEAETAAILDCSPGTVKSQLAKAREKLRAALGAADRVRGESNA